MKIRKIKNLNEAIKLLESGSNIYVESILNEGGFYNKDVMDLINSKENLEKIQKISDWADYKYGYESAVGFLKKIKIGPIQAFETGLYALLEFDKNGTQPVDAKNLISEMFNIINNNLESIFDWDTDDPIIPEVKFPVDIKTISKIIEKQKGNESVNKFGQGTGNPVISFFAKLSPDDAKNITFNPSKEDIKQMIQ